VFEVHVSVAPAGEEFPDARGYFSTAGIGVVALAEAEIAEVGGEDFGDFELVGFRQTEGDISRGEAFINRFRQP